MGVESREPCGDLTITLAFEDLQPDANGEIVIVGPRGLPGLSIVTDRAIEGAGIAPDHVMAGGFAVSGLTYLAFEGGTRLYFTSEVDITVLPAQG